MFIVDQDREQILRWTADFSFVTSPTYGENHVVLGFNLFMVNHKENYLLGTFESANEANQEVVNILSNESNIYVIDGYYPPINEKEIYDVYHD